MSIKFMYDLCSNYITHLYTLGNIGFEDPLYENKYAFSINTAELNLLKQHKPLLQFSQGVNGLYAAVFYFIAAYNDLHNEKQWQDYFNAWNEQICNKNDSLIMPYFKNHYMGELYQQYQNVDLQEWQTTVTQIFNVFINNISTYQQRVYCKIETILAERCLELNKQLLNIDYITKWKHITHYKYPYNAYNVALYYAGHSGPSWNNISLYKNTAYYNHNTEFMLDMISHELGIHVMITDLLPVMNDLKTKGYKHANVYYCFEMLATYYNTLVLNKQGADIYNEQCQEIVDFYKSQSNSKSYKPKELLIKAVKYFTE